ncbi:MAG: hypothetical protein K2M34_01580 [Alphaproteobacteria bacterium]|nr:hypothetical protein [Alphaproteobacteria bacterium]
MYNKYIIIIAMVICAFATTHAYADQCIGATYYSAEHELCMDCPPGFDADTTDGKTDISQCRIACRGGYYPAPSDKYAILEYVHFDNQNNSDTAIQNHNTAFDTNVYLTGSDTLRAVFYPLSTTMMSIAGHHAGQGANNTSFQLYSQFFRYGGQINRTQLNTNQIYDASIGAGGLIINGKKIHDYNYVDYTQTATCKIGAIDTADSQYYGNIYGVYIYRDNNLIHRYTPVRRISDNSIGFYDDLTDTFLENKGYGTATGGPESPLYVCTPVGAGFWASESPTNYGATDTRNQCPAGLTTVGYGPGADEAGDCGHTLHIGNNAKIYLRSDKKTSPSLHIQINDKVFYANMTPHNIGSLRTQIGDTVYSIIDDTIAAE